LVGGTGLGLLASVLLLTFGTQAALVPPAPDVRAWLIVGGLVAVVSLAMLGIGGLRILEPRDPAIILTWVDEIGLWQAQERRGLITHIPWADARAFFCLAQGWLGGDPTLYIVDSGQQLIVWPLHTWLYPAERERKCLAGVVSGW
jgi:hypothetical protein